MRSALKEAIEALEEHRNVEQAMPMEAYLKNQFPLLGIKTPLRKEILKKYLPLSELKSNADEYLKEVKTLWEMDEREYQYTALYIMDKLQRSLNNSHISLIKHCILTKSWWDTVDLLAAKNLGGFIQGQNLFETPVNEWIYNENMWLNRAAIIVQLKYKEETDLSFLTAAIKPHLESKAFFHQKAIGWALREYSKTNADWVQDFCESNSLKALSRREALRLLQE